MKRLLFGRERTPIFRGRMRFPGPPIFRLARSKDFTQKVRKPKSFSAHKVRIKDFFLSSTAVFRVRDFDTHSHSWGIGEKKTDGITESTG